MAHRHHYAPIERKPISWVLGKSHAYNGAVASALAREGYSAVTFEDFDLFTSNLHHARPWPDIFVVNVPIVGIDRIREEIWPLASGVVSFKKEEGVRGYQARPVLFHNSFDDLKSSEAWKSLGSAVKDYFIVSSRHGFGPLIDKARQLKPDRFKF